MMKIKIEERIKTGLKSNDERGVSLVEAAVAIMLLGGAVLTMVLSLSGGALAVQVNDEQVTAQALGRTQMEYIKECSYNVSATTYPAVAHPDSYNITVTVTTVPNTSETIQKITANITRSGEELLTIQDYKYDR